MKKKLIAIFFGLLFVSFHIQLSGQSYCIPTYTSGNTSGDYISLVKIGSINNASGKASGPNYYSDFTAQSATLVQNNLSTISITNGTFAIDSFAVWIDYNHDFDFYDPGELVGRFKSTAASQSNSINFLVPSAALTGSTRLRVRCIWNTLMNPCNTFAYGETEDYSVQILPRFSEKSSILLSGDYASAVWTDINNDGYLDALFTYGGSGLLHIYQNTSGTSFSDVNTGLEGPKRGIIVPGDYNRDGNIDVLVSGTREDNIYPTTFFTRIYKNNGGTFTDIGAGLPGLYLSSADWGDFDNDGDLDIILSGLGALDPITKVYENKGSDVFSEFPAILKGSSEGDCAWWDFNNDSFLDIIVSGLNIDGNSEIAIYRNNKGQSFSRIAYDFLNIPGSLDIGDYDQDGDPDIIITGEENMQPDVGGYPKTALYRNDGNETFTLINTGMQDLREADAKFGDADNDGDLDILLLGRHLLLADRYIQLYLNKGNDIFELETMTMIPLYGGELDWGDYDNDNDLDFLYTGNDRYLRIIENKTAAASPNTPPLPPTILSSKMVGNGIEITFNSGSDNKSLANGLTYNLMVGTTSGAIDIVSPGSNTSTGRMKYTKRGNLNQNKTILISGLPVGTYHWRVQSIDQSYAGSAFTGNQTVAVTDPFTEVSPAITQVSYGRSEWADLNSDGNQDLILTGTTSGPATPTPSTSFWFKGTGDVFTAYSGNNTLEGVWISSVSPIDYDGDNDLDVFIYGRNAASQYVSKLYQNTNGNFTSVTHSFGTGGQAAWGDVDNDGDQDLLIQSGLFKRNSNGSYTASSFGSSGGSIYSIKNVLIDFDNDGDLDDYRSETGQLYKNDGNGNFTLASSAFTALSDNSVDIGDYDNDKDLDIVVSGYKNYSRESYIYRNNGDGTFTDIKANIRAVETGRVIWIDYDNDGDLDVSMTGESSTEITRIFLNMGNDSFEPITVNLPEYYDSDINWADYDNDGDMDLLYAGRIATPTITKIYRNNNNYPNQQPVAPGNLISEIQGQTATLSWTKSVNPSDTVETMSYNVRIGKTPGSCDILSPQSNLSTGKPLKHKIGNAQMAEFKILKNLPVGTYYWSVQALDKNSNYSSWAPEKSFTVNVLQADFSATSVCKGLSTSFTDQSFAYGVTVETWLYDFGDGTTSASRNPVHIYTNDGAYNVTLTIGSGSYTDIITKQVVVYKSPVANFNANIACQGNETSFTNTTNLNGLTVSSWYWDFGGGKASTLQTPLNPGLLIAGEYNVKLRVTTAEHGCISEITKTVTVAAYPSSTVSVSGPLQFCKGDSVSLSVEDKSTYTYEWRLEGVNITGANTSIYKAKLSGNYSVSVNNPLGNCSQTSGIISVIVASAPSKPAIVADGDTTFCSGDSVILSITANPDYTYQWKLNGGSVGSNANRLTAKSTGEYDLLVRNSSGCTANSVNKVNVTVKPSPSAGTIIVKGEEKFCKGESVTLSVPLTTGYLYSWKKGTNPLGLTTNSIVVSEPGDYTVDISLSDCKINPFPVKIEVVDKPAKPEIDHGSYTKGMCLGDKYIELSVDQVVPGYAYQWYKNETPISNDIKIAVTEAATYYLEASIDICTSERNSDSIVFGPTLPKPSIDPMGPTVWYLSTTSKAANYRWYFNGTMIPGATGSSYMAGQNYGIYRLAIANENGCYSFSDTLRIPTFRTTGIEDTDPFADIKIYPNPTTGMFTIEMNNNVFGELVIDIITQNGSKILNIKFDKTTEYFLSQIDLSGQSKGMYLINLSLDKFKAVRKVLVE